MCEIMLKGTSSCDELIDMFVEHDVGVAYRISARAWELYL